MAHETMLIKNIFYIKDIAHNLQPNNTWEGTGFEFISTDAFK